MFWSGAECEGLGSAFGSGAEHVRVRSGTRGVGAGVLLRSGTCSGQERDARVGVGVRLRCGTCSGQERNFGVGVLLRRGTCSAQERNFGVGVLLRRGTCSAQERNARGWGRRSSQVWNMFCSGAECEGLESAFFSGMEHVLLRSGMRGVGVGVRLRCGTCSGQERNMFWSGAECEGLESAFCSGAEHVRVRSGMRGVGVSVLLRSGTREVESS